MVVSFFIHCLLKFLHNIKFKKLSNNNFTFTSNLGGLLRITIVALDDPFSVYFKQQHMKKFLMIFFFPIHILAEFFHLKTCQ